MLDQLKEIGQRLSGLRNICEYSTSEMAEKLGISEEDLKNRKSNYHNCRSNSR